MFYRKQVQNVIILKGKWKMFSFFVYIKYP